MKFKVVIREGKPVRAGFCDFPLRPGESVEEYDDIQHGVVAELRKDKGDEITVQKLYDMLKAKGVL